MDHELPADYYTPIHNKVLEALFKVRLTAYETNILFCIWRYTYGFKDEKGGRLKVNDFSLTSLSQDTGIPRRAVVRTLKMLVDKKIITREKSRTGFSKAFMQIVSPQTPPSVTTDTTLVSSQTLPLVSPQTPPYIKKKHLRENSKKNKLTNVSFGNPDINEGIDLLKASGIETAAGKMNRYSLHRLYKKFGKDKTLRAMKFAMQVKDEPYSPVITSYLDLEHKWDKLVSFGVRHMKERREHGAIDATNL